MSNTAPTTTAVEYVGTPTQAAPGFRCFAVAVAVLFTPIVATIAQVVAR